MEAALEAGAEDVVTMMTARLMSTLHGKKWVKCASSGSGRSESRQRGSFHDPVYKADMDAETAPKLMRLIDMLEIATTCRKFTITVKSLMRSQHSLMRPAKQQNGDA